MGTLWLPKQRGLLLPKRRRVILPGIDPSRSFDGTDDKITLALGGLNFAFGPGSVAAIYKPASDGVKQVLFAVGSQASVSWDLYRDNTTNAMGIRCNGAESEGSTAVLQANGWVMVGGSKASGTAAAAIHIYRYDTDTFVHETGAVAVANSSVPTVRAQIGCRANSAQFTAGEILVVGAWNTVLSNAEFESLPFNLQNWVDLAADGLLRLNQASVSTPVEDLTGTSDETAIVGTTVSASEPPGWSDSGGGDSTAPVVNLNSSLTHRMSDEVTKDSYNYSFSVDEACQAWKVKVVTNTSDPHTAGTEIESGGSVSVGTPVTGSVTYSELVAAGVGAEGDKRLKAFAQDLAGNWST